MAKLMECKTCGGKISSTAASCPHCGEDGGRGVKATKKSGTSMFTWIILIGIISAIAIPKLSTTSQAYTQPAPKVHTPSKPNIPTPVQAKAHKKDLSKQKEKLIDLVKKEKNVFGPTWENEDFLTFGMMDNGTQRDGFAQYICVLKNEAGLEGHRIFVKIYDAKLMMNGGEAKVIGKTTCN